jgi:hypothetical protein
MSESLIVEYDKLDQNDLIRLVLLVLPSRLPPPSLANVRDISIILLLTISQHPPQKEFPCLFVLLVVDAPPTGTATCV